MGYEGDFLTQYCLDLMECDVVLHFSYYGYAFRAWQPHDDDCVAVEYDVEVKKYFQK